MEKKWFGIVGALAAVITALVLAVVIVGVDNRPPTRFDKYQQYAKDVNIVDWTISEDTAKSFAEANCEKLDEGDMPAIRFKNGEHVKSSGAVIAAYCPKSFDNFLAGIALDYPEYISVVEYLNYRIKV
jgi:hypothetical protein